MGSVVIMGATAMAGTISESAVPTTNAQPFGIAAGLDGSVWFTEVAGNKIGRLSVGGTFTEFPASGNPGGITLGPDGAFWFTEIGGNKIGQITGSGTIAEFSMCRSVIRSSMS